MFDYSEPARWDTFWGAGVKNLQEELAFFELITQAEQFGRDLPTSGRYRARDTTQNGLRNTSATTGTQNRPIPIDI
jgi:hypothetical protein